ncbi:MAG: extracellular solute-binding protein [Desulfobacterales bacterium]|nr:extracellular solute-binding protein [Desulfobacterales bacterium]
MSEKYGINLDFVAGRGSEIIPKMQAEQRAGLYLADIIAQGTNTFLTSMKPMGLLGQIEPLLILPEVLDPKAWPDGQIPFPDKEHTVIPMTMKAQRYFTYNTTLIKKGELTSYKDALNPEYEGKINLIDPSNQGSGNAFFSFLTRLWSLEEAKVFLRRLITDQKVVLTRSYRGQVESVAKGKYAIGLGTQGSAVEHFLRIGAPISDVPLKEVSASHENGVVAIPKTMAHPNAGTVFLNWLLTKEGQTIFSQGTGAPVMRVDVSSEGINPTFMIKPGDKVFYDSEEYINFKGRMKKVAKEIIDAHLKR